jgi:aminobenzoyl-glutamate utilization protein B
MAATAIMAIHDETLVARAKADLKARTAATPYVCPLPAGIQPPKDMSKVA